MAESERKEIMEVFDTIAEEFFRSRRRVWKSLEDAGPFEGEIVLDLGAGCGRNSRFIAERGAALVVAADISSEMLKVLMSNLKGGYSSLVQSVRCDALYLPFSQSVFDKVIFVATIHHIPGNLARLRAIQEVKRVLKQNGAVLVTGWALIQIRFLRRLPTMILNWLKGREFGDLYIPWGEKKRFYHLFTVRGLTALVKDAGFCVEKAYGEKVRSRIFAENCVVLARKV